MKQYKTLEQFLFFKGAPSICRDTNEWSSFLNCFVFPSVNHLLLNFEQLHPFKKKKCSSTHTNKKYINKICFALLLVPTGQQTCVYMCMCLYVLCMVMCWLVLQALVEIDGGGVWTGLSYPLLQLWLQPAHAHRAAKRRMNPILKNAAAFWKTLHVQE